MTSFVRWLYPIYSNVAGLLISYYNIDYIKRVTYLKNRGHDDHRIYAYAFGTKLFFIDYDYYLDLVFRFTIHVVFENTFRRRAKYSIGI